MNSQKTSSITKALSLMGVSAALLISLPVSAEMRNGSGNNVPVSPSASPSNPSGRVDPGADGVVSPNPNMPATGAGTSGSPSRGTGTVDPGAGGVVSPNPNMPASGAGTSSPTSRESGGTMGRDGSTGTGRSGDVKKGPSAVGEGFPGTSESPSGSPSVPGTSVYGNPAYESQPRRN